MQHPDDDYPCWTRYSASNPDGERRVYCGVLLYAFSDGWMAPGADDVLRRAPNREEAKRAAERWAEERMASSPDAPGPDSVINDEVGSKLATLVERMLESVPSNISALVCFWAGGQGRKMELVTMSSSQPNDETLRMLREAQNEIEKREGGARKPSAAGVEMMQKAKEAADGEVQHHLDYGRPVHGRRDGHPVIIGPPHQLVTSVAVHTMGGHDHLQVWSRGGLAGELVVSAGDGMPIAERLLPMPAGMK